MQFTINVTKGRVLLTGTLVAALILAGCTSDKNPGQTDENRQQAEATEQLVRNQKLPKFEYSQMRQNLIEIETAQAQGVQTTSFFFNEGVKEPIFVCPSVGVPIPNTASLSNPQAVAGDSYGRVTVNQMDPNGAYVPESSSGTYVICLGKDGAPFAKYWEGNVDAVFGPAKWNKETGQEELTGPASFHFSQKQGG